MGLAPLVVKQALAEESAVSQPDYASTKKDLTAFIQKEMDKDNVKGLSLALVDGDKVVWKEGFGMADEKNHIPATAGTLYRVDSISKILTAMEIMRLAGKGRIGLDEPIEEALPGFSIHSRFKGSKDITVRSLLAHHSEPPGRLSSGHVGGKSRIPRPTGRGPETGLPGGAPQSFYKYSDLDYSLLGRIIELKEHRSFTEAMRDNLFKPLGMDSSTFDLSPVIRERMAKGYSGGKERPPLYYGTFRPGAWFPTRTIWPASSVFFYGPTLPHGAGNPELDV